MDMEWTPAVCSVLEAAVQNCLNRTSAWHMPPNWDSLHWTEELAGVGWLAAWRATGEFDARRGVPFGAFLRVRILAEMLSHFRREWAFARRCLPLANEEDEGSDASAFVTTPCASHFDRQLVLWEVRAMLPEVHARLIEELFWQGRTEASVAVEWGVCQQAVSRQKRAALRELRAGL